MGKAEKTVLAEVVREHQRIRLNRRLCLTGASLVAQMVVSVCNAGDPGSIPGLGRSAGEGNGSPLQYSCLENPMDGGAWLATVHGVAKSRTRLSDFTTTISISCTGRQILYHCATGEAPKAQIQMNKTKVLHRNTTLA